MQENIRRSSSNRPQQAIYTPGSGPLRKSDQQQAADDESAMSSTKAKNPAESRMNRVRQEEFNSSLMRGESQDARVKAEMSERRRSKKPEQPIYVPTPVAKARQENEKKQIEQDAIKNERERARSELERNERNLNGAKFAERERNSNRNKRYSSKRNSSKGIDGRDEWSNNSPNRSFRQGSEPKNQQNPPTQNNWGRMRDTRSVEPVNTGRNYQPETLSRNPPNAKPPSGRRHSTICVEPDKRAPKSQSKLDNLPPRLRKKRLEEAQMAGNPLLEEPWDGTSSLTFQGTTAPSLAPNQHVTGNNKIYSTLPMPSSRPRGRGRLQTEAYCAPHPGGTYHRPLTPDKFSSHSSSNSITGTPTMSQSGRTASNESVNRCHSRSQTPVNYRSSTAADDHSYGNQGKYATSDGHRNARFDDAEELQRDRENQNVIHKSLNRNAGEYHSAYKDLRENLNYIRARELKGADDKEFSRVDNSNVNANAAESKDTAPKSASKEEKISFNSHNFDNEIFDWSEEVELHVKNLEEGLSDAMTRSSSMASITDSVSKPQSRGKRPRKKKKDRRNRRSMSSNRERSSDNRYSEPPQGQSQHRTRKISGDHQFKAPEPRRRRESRDHSFDRGRTRSRNGSRESSFERRRKVSCSDTTTSEMNWRDEIRARTVDKEPSRFRGTSERSLPPPVDENVRRAGVLHLPKSSPKPPVLTMRDRPSEIRRPVSNSNTSQNLPHSGAQKTLFDPHNPNKPIIINKPNSRVSSHSLSENSETPNFTTTDQLGNVRPAWHNENSENFHHSHYPDLLKDIRLVDAELLSYGSPQLVIQYWPHIQTCRAYLKEALVYLLREDMKFSENENVEQYFWKLLYHNFIEIMRRAIDTDPQGSKLYKDFILDLIKDGTEYYENVLEILQAKYNFKLENFTGAHAYSKSSGYLQLALVSAQKIYIFLGDLYRYKERVNQTTNYGKCRQLYIKSHEINSKNGRPYNQLAVLALQSRKRMDAVYYYMRSLMSTNPVQSARESLNSLFDENRKKYEHERKRREERLEKARMHMREKESENAENRPGSLRRETWIRPDGGRRMHRTTSTLQETKVFDSDEEDLAALTSVEVNKRFVTSYLHVHGKLITKIGMESFLGTAVQMLKEFRALLQHSPLPLSSSRFLQLLALNMFAIESTKLKGPDLQPGLRSELQERALIVSLEMFSLILEKCVSILGEHLHTATPENINALPHDALELLPSVKIWCDWMLCHSRIWNPPPSTQDYKVGPAGDAWTRVATLMNLLENLDQSIMRRFKEEPSDGYELVRLPEDNTLSGFTPLLCNVMPTSTYVAPDTDIESAQFALRLQRLLFFGTEFLCGVEPPVLKLTYRNDSREYVSVVCTSASRSAPNSPPVFNESELLVESFSGEEDCNPESVVLENTSNEIQELLTRKSELEARQRDQELHRQAVQKILQQNVSVHIEVKPKNLVPDTNCFIDYLPQLKTIASSNVYTLMVPLIVLNELEGLAKGAKTPVMNPAHALKVAEASKAALDYLGTRAAGVKCITTKGTILASTAFTKEDDAIVDVSATNDDRILQTCMTLCKTPTEQIAGEPRKIHRDVVLLTEDRNLRVKALARDVPVREVLSFLQWAGLG